jgi:hypothetical protein
MGRLDAISVSTLQASLIDDIPAVRVGAGCSRRDLSSDGSVRVWVVDMEPGSTWPYVDDHDTGEHYYVIEGRSDRRAARAMAREPTCASCRARATGRGPRPACACSASTWIRRRWAPRAKPQAVHIVSITAKVDCRCDHARQAA